MLKSVRPRHTLLLSVIAVLALTAGCASIPKNQEIVNQKAYSDPSQATGNCNVSKLLQPGNVQASAENMLNGESISLLNWNVHKGLHDQWEADFRRLGTESDIVTIQEALLKPALRDLLAEQDRYWNLNTAFYLNNIETGVLTASKTRPEYICALRTSEPIIRLPKTILISRYPISGEQHHLVVVNVHGINFELGTETYKKQLLALQTVLSHHQGPIIIAGDFNSWSARRMQLVTDMANALSLKALAYQNHDRTTIFGNAVDHVFYRGLEPVVHNTHRVATSDHNPTVVTFRSQRSN